MLDVSLLEDLLGELDDEQLREIWNEYCLNNGWSDDVVEYNDIDTVCMYISTPEEMYNSMNEDYDKTDEYFSFNGYDLESYNDLYDKVDLWQLASGVINDGMDLSDYGINEEDYEREKLEGEM